MTTMRRVWAVCVAAGLVLVTSAALAQPPCEGDGGARGERGARRGPPPEAVEACARLDIGDACQVTTRRGALDGTCREVPEEVKACVPDGHRPPPRGDGEGRRPGGGGGGEGGGAY